MFWPVCMEDSAEMFLHHEALCSVGSSLCEVEQYVSKMSLGPNFSRF